MDKTQIDAVILKHVKETLEDLDVSTLDFNKSIKDYGADSLDVVDIVSGSMQELEIKVPLSELGKVQTINQLSELFLSHTSK